MAQFSYYGHVGIAQTSLPNALPFVIFINITKRKPSGTCALRAVLKTLDFK